MRILKKIKQKIHYSILLYKWEDKFQDSISLIHKLEKYRHELWEIDVNLVDSNSILKNQKAWISLFTKFKLTDRRFFKPYWVWINADSNGYFIDISKAGLPIFEYKFHCLEPYHWKLIPKFDSIDDLISKLQDGKYIEDYKSEKNKTLEERLEDINFFSS